MIQILLRLGNGGNLNVNRVEIFQDYAVNIFIHQLNNWPSFTWDAEKLAAKLGSVRHRQGKILGQMLVMGFHVQEETMLQALTLDVVKSSEIEGELLNMDQVRSSIARRLGIDAGETVAAERDVEGVVELMLDATQHYEQELKSERLFCWHAALFPTGRSGRSYTPIALQFWERLNGETEGNYY